MKIYLRNFNYFVAGLCSMSAFGAGIAGNYGLCTLVGALAVLNLALALRP